MAAVDRNTGQPYSSYNNTTDFNQSVQTGPQTINTQGQTTQQTTSNQQNNVASYSLNTTPEVRDAINRMVAQLSDRNVVSDAEAKAKFPEAVPIYTRSSGWIYQHPVTKLTISPQEAKIFNDAQAAKRASYVQSGGMIAGGTLEQKQQQTERKTEITRNRAQQDKYSKEAAFVDSKALTDYFTRVLTEQQLPGILRGAEGAGASVGTTRALLAQDAIARASESAAKTGVETAVAYAGISNQLAPVLEALTRSDPNGPAAQLLQLFQTAKGIETSGVQSSNVQTTQTVQSNTQQTQQQSGQQIDTTKTYATAPALPAGDTLTVPTAYQPAANAGTGYIIANQPEPYKDVNFTQNDSGLFFE